MEIEITWTHAIRVWWSLFWRNLIAIIVAMLMGGLVGGVIGFVMGLMGFPVRLIQIVCAPIGFIIGIAVSVVPVKMILGKTFGEFRLILVSSKQDENTDQSKIQEKGIQPSLRDGEDAALEG